MESFAAEEVPCATHPIDRQHGVPARLSKGRSSSIQNVFLVACRQNAPAPMSIQTPSLRTALVGGSESKEDGESGHLGGQD